MLSYESRRALVALGANLPFDGFSPVENLRRALTVLSQEGLLLRAVSRFFRTPCFPAGSGPEYVNAAAVLDVPQDIDATSLLGVFHRVEALFGRARAERWGMRTLDIDLLALGDSVFPDAAVQGAWRALAPADQARQTPDRLILPHPRLQDRAFVLVPLAEVAADWVHPLTGDTVLQMRDRLPPADVAAVMAGAIPD